MKAQKSCPKCSKKVHARVSQCECSYVFYAKKEKKEEKPKVAGAGPGRKQCPSCSDFIGVRNARCPKCDHDFSKVVKVAIREDAVKAEKEVIDQHKKLASNPVAKVRNTQTVATRETEVFPFEGAPEVDGVFNGRVTVPSGKCPFDLKDFSEDGILTWAEKVAKAYKGGRLTYGALEYFARRYYGYPSDKTKEESIKTAFYGS